MKNSQQTAANAGYKSPYVIRARRTFYNSRDRHSLCMEDDGSAPLIFATPAEARSEIRRRENRTHYQAHGEYGRPDYRVCRADRLPAYLETYL